MEDKELKLIRDIPAYSDRYEPEKDVFNHYVYANTLLRIIEKNSGPLVMGLLGPWGYGKSTILNILRNNLLKNEEEQRYKVVYFNAWKYANDSFRRQFLIECVDKLIENEKERKKRKREIQHRFIKDFRKEIFSWKELLKLNIKPDISTFLAIILSLLIIAPFLCYGLISKNTPLWISSLILGVFMFIIEKQLPKLFQVNIPVEINPQIFLPEHFETAFKKLIKECDKKIIFIIDDIDRCPPHMIMEILDASKTFFASPDVAAKKSSLFQRCYFIMAMDDKAVTSTLRKYRSKKYANEEVLKFFDVILRIHPIKHSDLIEFANKIAEETGIDKRVIDIAIYGGFDTPRKIKHFLNIFKVVYSIAEERKKEGLFNYELNEIMEKLAKILVLQIRFPTEFEELRKDIRRKLKEWEERAKESEGSGSDLENFLWATQDISITDFESFLYFKIPAYASSILPFYFNLKDAIFYYKENEIRELIDNISTEEQKESLKRLLHDLLADQKPSGEMLKKILLSSLLIYQLINFEEDTKKFLARLIVTHIERYGRVLEFDPEVIFNLLENLDQKEDRKKRIVYHGIENIHNKPLPKFTASFLKILYREKHMERFLKEVSSSPSIDKSKKVYEEVNEALKSVGRKNLKWLVETLKLFSLPDGFDWQKINYKVPSLEIIKDILLPQIDEKEEKVSVYEDIVDISFKFWYANFNPILCEKCVNILTYYNNQSITSLNPSLRLVLKVIKEMPDWPEKTVSTKLIPQLNTLWNRIKKIDEKLDVLEAWSIVCYPVASGMQYIEQIATSSIKLDSKSLLEFIKFIESYKKEEDWWAKLESYVVDRNIDTIESNLHEPDNLKKFDELYSYKGVNIPFERVKKLLEKIMQSNEKIIKLWENEILTLSKQNKEILKYIVEKSKSMIKITNRNFEQRRLLFEMMIKITKTVDVEEMKIDVGNFIFELLKQIGAPELVRLGTENLHLAKDFLRDSFKPKLNSEVQEICKKSIVEISNYQMALLSCLDFPDEWEEESYNDLVNLLRNMISQNYNLTLARTLFEKVQIKKIPEERLKELKGAVKLINDQEERKRWEELFKKHK